MLPRLMVRQSNRPVETLNYWANKDGSLLLDPPYQRGDVWGFKRRRNLIRSLLMEIPIPAIIINERFLGEGWGNDFRIAVIDGRQRVTTLLMFMQSEFSIPVEWLDPSWIEKADGNEIRFTGFSQLGRRKFGNRGLPFCEARASSLEEEKMIFDLINFGGLQQGEVDDDL